MALSLSLTGWTIETGQTRSKLEQEIASVRTWANHDGMATGDESETNAANQKANRHQSMTDTYRALPGRACAAGFQRHCDGVVRQHEQSTEENLALGKLYRKMTAEAKDQTPEKRTRNMPKDAERTRSGTPDPQQQLEKLHDVVEGRVDPLGLFTPIAHAELAWLMHPQELAQNLGRLSTDLMALQIHSWRRTLGLSSEDPVQPHPDDSRFTDPAWKDSVTSDILKEWYLLLTRHVQDALHETPGLSGKERRRAAYWWREWLNAMAPTNFFWTNPVAIRKFFETDGDSVARGMRIFLEDLKAGTVRMANLDDFALGENLATMPGAVVYRSSLIEIIHYAPTTQQVYEMPIVIVMPWINKFYVLDLTPKKSMVKYLLDQGFSVFITSWKNATADMRDTTFDDYLTQLPQLVTFSTGGWTPWRRYSTWCS